MAFDQDLAASVRTAFVGAGAIREVKMFGGARPMVMRGRTMEGYIYVDPSALNDQAVQKWLQLAVAFVQTLPPSRPHGGRSRR